MQSGGIGDKFFAVKIAASHFFVEGFCEFEYEDALPLIEVCEVFPARAAEEIVSRCRAAFAGNPNYNAFSINLGMKGWHIVTLLHTEGSSVFFHARNIERNLQSTTQGTGAIVDCLHKLNQTSTSGLFIWRVTNGPQFVLTYANSALESLMGVGAASCGKLPEDIFSPAEASFLLTHLSSCQTTKKPVSVTQNRGSCILSIRLVPGIENGRVTRLYGTVLDITEFVSSKKVIEPTMPQFGLCDRQLNNQLAFLEMILKTSRAFMDTGHSGFEDCIGKLAESIGQIMDTDYVSIVKCTGASHTIEYEWKTHIKYASKIGTAIYSASESLLHQGRMLISNDVEKDMASSRHPLFNAVMPTGVRSVLAIPVLHGDEIFGAICLAEYNHNRYWTTTEISLIKKTCETIMSAYLRIKSEIRLCESNRILVEYDESLQDMLAIEEIKATVSQSFIVSDCAHFDQCVIHMLRDVSELFEMDAAFVCISENKQNDMIYQWNRQGLPHFHLNFKDPEPDLPLWHGIQTHPLAIDNMMERHVPLPPNINENMAGAGVKSLLCVPLCFGSTVVGVFVFCKIVGWHRWTAVQIDAAKAFADIFLGAQSKNAQQETQITNKQDSEISHALIQAPEKVQRLTSASANELPSLFACICGEFAKNLCFESVSITGYHQTKKIFVWNAKKPQRQKKKEAIQKICRTPLIYENATWGCLYVCFSGGHSNAMRVEMMRMFAQVYINTYMRFFPYILATPKDFFLERRHKNALEPKPVTV